MLIDGSDTGSAADAAPGASFGSVALEDCLEHDPDRDYDPVHDDLRPEAPDSLDQVLEIAGMMSSFAADRYVRVEAMRREAHEEAVPFRGGIPEMIDRSLRLELASALLITEHAAESLLQRSQAMVERYPSMLELLSRGRTTERHAEVLVDLLAPVESELLDQIVPVAVALAEELPLGSFRRELRKLVETVRAVTLEERHTEALETRRVAVTFGDDGMAWLAAHVPSVEAQAILNRATAVAKVLADVEGETRTIDQLRADVVCDLLIDGRTDTHPEAARGIRATVAVTVPALSLLDDEYAASHEPAIVEGVGPIPIGRARELCGNADGWMRILTHPETGVVLSVGRESYKPPAALKRLVRWRAGRCLAPGCGMPTTRCQIDHTIPWVDGGRTELTNLGPFCEGHHIVKHHGGWVVRQIEGSGGAIEWISPAGRRYVVKPERSVPVFRPSVAEQGVAPF